MAFLSNDSSDSESTEESNSASEENAKKSYSHTGSQRQASSSSATSEPTSEHSSDHGVRRAEKPAPSTPVRATQAKKADPVPKPQSKIQTLALTLEKPKPKSTSKKRNKDEENGEEPVSVKKKSTSKKANPGKKSITDTETSQQEDVALTLNPQTEEKPPSAKTAKEKKIAHKEDKKSRKRVVQETLGSPSVKDSPLKSAKKTQHVWSDKDEMILIKGVVDCVKRGMEIPKNVAQVHDLVKDSLEYDCTKGQLYEKLRRMKGRYQSIRGKMKEGSIKEDTFHFRSEHEKNIFKLWKLVWSEEPAPAADEDEEMEENPAEENRSEDALKMTNEQAEEHAAIDGDSQDQEEEGEQDDMEPKIDVAAPVRENGKVVPADAPLKLSDYMSLQEENRSLIAQVKNDLQKMVEDSQSSTKALIENLFKTNGNDNHRAEGVIPPSSSIENLFKLIANNNHRPGVVTRPSSSVPIRSKDLMDGVFSVKEFPILDSTKVEMLEQKWREQQFLEMKVFSQRLDLLQEECKVCLEGLKATTDSSRS
eukprot:Gb_32309 [translate_table: standard]